MNGAFSPRLADAFLERVCDVSAEPVARAGSYSCEALGQSWRKAGVRPGDLVLLALPNGSAVLEQFFGILAAGAVPALVAPSTPSARLRELEQILRARALVAARINAELLGVREHQQLGHLEVGLFEPAAEPLAAPGEVVLMTSGTSGFASGCVFPLEALLLNAERHAEAIGQRPTDVVLVNLPLYFSFALVAQALASLLRGNRLVLHGPPFHVPTYVQTLTRHAVTVSSLTPVLVQSLLQQEALLPAELRVLTVGGDSLAPEDVAGLLARRPGGELYLTYGLTQAGPRVSTLAAHAEPPERFASVGLPLSGTQVSLQDLGDGSGLKQLLVSSASVMRRRIGLVENQPQQDAPTPGTIATGDIFDQDQDGYLFFRGRLTDYIIRDGEKICLVAVRRVAGRLPHVIHARTRVVSRSDGKTDFELLLHTTAADQDYAGLLRKIFRRAEMPGRIHVETVGQGSSHSYK
jgi:acyl-CoA synthetase (AMP-forming)/AMP-acid ligase II